jgi:hypothetical protein
MTLKIFTLIVWNQQEGKMTKVFFPHYTHVNHVSKRKREKAKRKMEKPKEKNHDLNKELQSVLQRQLCSYEL